MMRYQIQASPSVTVARQQEELARLRRYAGQLQLHWLRVGPPHRPQVEPLQLLEVPERWAEHAQQLLTALTGCENAAARTVYRVRRRPEWGTSLLLYPTAEAQALDGAVLAGAASAWLCVRTGWWGTLATLRVGAADVDAVLAAAGARGWAASPRGGQALLSQLRGTGRNTPLALGAVAPAEDPEAPMPVAAQLPVIAAVSSPLLAATDTSGWLLGVRDDGRAVELTWGNHIVALDGPREAVQGALRALVRRALGLPRDAAPGVPPDTSLGVVALLDRQLLDWPDLERFAARLWRLDARDRWSSIMVPWRSLPPAALAEVLRWHGLTAPLPNPLPAGLDELLAQLGGSHLATAALRDLTAHPGDNVRAALAAGGGLVQLRDGAPEEDLLTDLLLAVLAEPPALGRPLLLIRPAGLAVPPALALQAIQLVIGPEAGAAATLRSSLGGRSGWHLTWADGSAPLALQADLDAEPLSTRNQIHARIIAGLGEAGAAPTMGPSIPAGAPDEEPWEALVEAAFEAAATEEAAPGISVDQAGIARDELDAEGMPAGVLDEAVWNALADAALGVHAGPATGEAVRQLPGADLDLGDDRSVETEAQSAQRRVGPIRRRPRQRFGTTRLSAHPEEGASKAVPLEHSDEPEPGQPAPILAPGERSPADERPASPIGDQFGDTPFWLVEPSYGADVPSRLPGAEKPQHVTAEAVEQPLHQAAPLSPGGEPSHDIAPLRSGWGFPAEPAPPASAALCLADVEEPQYATAEAIEQPLHGTVMAPDQQVYRVSLHDPASWRAVWQAGVAQAELLRCLQALDPTADRVVLRQQLREHLLASVAAPPAPAPTAPLHATEPHLTVPPIVAPPPSHGANAGAVAQPAETGTLASDTLDDPEARTIWAAWQAGEPLDQLLIARCGYARGKAAEHTKDGIYRAVVPQILHTLQAEALVPMLLAGVELAGEQVEQYEQVLRLLARIDRPATGVLRTQMHNRLVLVIQQQLREA